jgi:hypothetical protein
MRNELSLIDRIKMEREILHFYNNLRKIMSGYNGKGNSDKGQQKGNR